MSRREAILPFRLDALDLSDRCLLAAVVLLPWAFGGIEIWAHRSAAFLILSAAALHVWRGAEGKPSTVGVRAILVPAALLLVLAGVQVLPLPRAVIATVSPHAQAIYDDTFDHGAGGRSVFEALEQRALERVPEARDLPLPRPQAERPAPAPGGRWSGWRTLSLAPSFTVERLHWYGALLVAFVLVRRRAGTAERYRAFRSVLFLNFLALAMFGLFYAVAGNERLYWIRPTVQPARPFGPFVNPTNFAAMMELATPWLVAAAWSSRRRRPGDLPGALLVAGACCCLLAGLLAGSKAAALLLALSVGWLAIRFQPSWGRRLAVAGGIGTLGLLSIPVLRLTVLGERVRQFVDTSGGGLAAVERVSGWRAAGSMLADYPWTGVGIGAFAEVFPRYAPAGGWSRLAHLHNDYFEVLLETGIPGAVVVAALAVAFFVAAFRGTRGRPTRQGLLVGLLALSVHAAVDFNHQIPALALTFVTMGALAVADREEPEA